MDSVKNQTDDREHYGLMSLDERAELIGGHLRIISQLGSGTKILARIPLREENNE